jgi:hypothetical protein
MQGEASTLLGFTDYFRVELEWSKLLGTVLLLAPVPSGRCNNCRPEAVMKGRVRGSHR